MHQESEILEAYNTLSSNSKTAFQFTRCVDECESKHWNLYYNKCFDIFSKLWSFQSKHRSLLEKRLGFSRKDVGDIANKIGQLYYHYYLRTSDKSHLKEAFSFLDAIRQRKYYSNGDEIKPELRLKHLRCCARLLMISFISNNRLVTLEVIKELDSVINQLNDMYLCEGKRRHKISPNTLQHIQQWTRLLLDIKKFTQGLGYEIGYHVHFNVLMTFSKLERGDYVSRPDSLHISKAVIINSEILQPQFDCFTLDTFRIFSAFDRVKPSPDSDCCSLIHPQKKTLNNPSSLDVLLTITQMAKDLDTPTVRLPNSDDSSHKCRHALFLYLSSSIREEQFVFKDTCALVSAERSGQKTLHQINHLSQHANLLRPDSIDLMDFEAIGVKTTEAMKSYMLERETCLSSAPPPTNKRARVSESLLKPDDLYSIMRKPLFMIVDGGLAEDFQGITSKFNEPLLCFLGPQRYPSKFIDLLPWNGNLLTSFLHRPALGLFLICGMPMDSIDLSNGQLIDELVDCEAKWTEEVLNQIEQTKTSLWVMVEGDQIARNFLARFIFAYQALKLHRDFTHPEMLPKMIPDISKTLEDSFLKNQLLTSILERIVELLNLSDFFCFISDMTFK